jgi:hypothetical protein
MMAVVTVGIPTMGVTVVFSWVAVDVVMVAEEPVTIMTGVPMMEHESPIFPSESILIKNASYPPSCVHEYVYPPIRYPPSTGMSDRALS